MSIAATIRVFCDANPSLETAAVNGLLAWAAVLGGCTVVFSGLPAVVALFIPAGRTLCRDGSIADLGRAFSLGCFSAP